MAEASRSGATGFKMQGDSWPSETISGTSLTAEYSHSTGSRGTTGPETPRNSTSTFDPVLGRYASAQ